MRRGRRSRGGAKYQGDWRGVWWDRCAREQCGDPALWRRAWHVRRIVERSDERKPEGLLSRGKGGAAIDDCAGRGSDCRGRFRADVYGGRKFGGVCYGETRTAGVGPGDVA